MEFIVQRFGAVSSTNDIAIRMAEEGAPEGTVVVAGEQTAGRGRHGRNWSSPAGEGLYISVILRPDLPFDRLWQMAFIAAVSAAEAIRQASGLEARIKWPNDILLNDRKVCGILIEAASRQPPAASSQPPAASSQHPAQNFPLPLAGEGQGEGERQRPALIVGIGVNVNTREFPAEIAETATSVARELGRVLPVREVERALLTCLAAHYDRYIRQGFPAMFEVWKSLDCTMGRRVTVHTPEGIVKGTAVEVTPTGDLVVEREGGARTRVSAGDVILRDAR